jgi:hypothetical protein
MFLGSLGSGGEARSTSDSCPRGWRAELCVCLLWFREEMIEFCKVQCQTQRFLVSSSNQASGHDDEWHRAKLSHCGRKVMSPTCWWLYSSFAL